MLGMRRRIAKYLLRYPVGMLPYTRWQCCHPYNTTEMSKQYTVNEEIIRELRTLDTLGRLGHGVTLHWGELGWPQCDASLAISVTPMAALTLMLESSTPNHSDEYLLQNLGDGWLLTAAPTPEQSAIGS